MQQSPALPDDIHTVWAWGGSSWPPAAARSPVDDHDARPLQPPWRPDRRVTEPGRQHFRPHVLDRQQHFPPAVAPTMPAGIEAFVAVLSTRVLFKRPSEDHPHGPLDGEAAGAACVPRTVFTCAPGAADPRRCQRCLARRRAQPIPGPMVATGMHTRPSGHAPGELLRGVGAPKMPPAGWAGRSSAADCA